MARESRWSADSPGLAAMDGNSPMVKALREGNGPPAGRYSAIGANHHPDAALWRRLVDAGIDSFFAGANDRWCRPTAPGKLRRSRATRGALTADRIACFGFDGNVQTGLGTVHHLNVLGQPDTARFITRALTGEPQGFPPLDLSQPRKSRQIWRGRAATATEATTSEILPITDAARTEPRETIAGRCSPPNDNARRYAGDANAGNAGVWSPSRSTIARCT